MTTRTLYGLDALGWALLHGLPMVLIESTPAPVAAARRVSHKCPDSVSIYADVGPHPWPQAEIDRLETWAYCTSPSESDATHDEYIAAGRLAAEQRALYDASDAGKIDRLEAALAAVVACEADVAALWPDRKLNPGVGRARGAIGMARKALAEIHAARCPQAEVPEGGRPFTWAQWSLMKKMRDDAEGLWPVYGHDRRPAKCLVERGIAAWAPAELIGRRLVSGTSGICLTELGARVLRDGVRR